MARHDELRVRRPLGSPGEQASLRPARRERVQRGLVGALVVHAGPGLLLRAAHLHRLTRHDAGHRRGRVVAVPDQDRPGGAHRDAGRLQADVEAVRAHVALLGRMVLGVDEDGVVGARGHARLAADADALVEVDDAVLAAEHRLGRAGTHARRIGALVAPGHLEGAAGLRELADIHGLHVGPGYPDRNFVLALAGGRARVASDALVLVEHLQPAHASRPVRRAQARPFVPAPAMTTFCFPRAGLGWLTGEPPWQGQGAAMGRPADSALLNSSSMLITSRPRAASMEAATMER